MLADIDEGQRENSTGRARGIFSKDLEAASASSRHEPPQDKPVVSILFVLR